MIGPIDSLGVIAIGLVLLVAGGELLVLCILGVSSLITPLVVSSRLIQFDVPLMVGVSILAWLLGYDGVVGRFDGIVLFGLLIGYIAICLSMSMPDRN